MVVGRGGTAGAYRRALTPHSPTPNTPSGVHHASKASFSILFSLDFNSTSSPLWAVYLSMHASAELSGYLPRAALAAMQEAL